MGFAMIRTQRAWLRATAFVVLTLALGACSNDDADPTPTPTATASVTTSTPTAPAATPTAEPTVPGYPPGTRTGNSDVDAVLAVLEQRDGPALRAIMRVDEVPCTHETGLGGPPKCPDGVAEGTPFPAFPLTSCEGRMVVGDGIDSAAANFARARWQTIWGVAEVPPNADGMYPPGDHLVVLAVDWGTPLFSRHVVTIEAGEVLVLQKACGQSVEDFQAGSWLLPPP